MIPKYHCEFNPIECNYRYQNNYLEFCNCLLVQECVKVLQGQKHCGYSSWLCREGTYEWRGGHEGAVPEVFCLLPEVLSPSSFKLLLSYFAFLRFNPKPLTSIVRYMDVYRGTTRMQARTTKRGQRIKIYSSRAAISSEMLIRISIKRYSELMIFWTANSYRTYLVNIVYFEPIRENYSPLTSAVRCWSGPWALCSSKVICDNIAYPLEKLLKLTIDTFPFEENKTWLPWQKLVVYIRQDQWSLTQKICVVKYNMALICPDVNHMNIEEFDGVG